MQFKATGQAMSYEMPETGAGFAFSRKGKNLNSFDAVWRDKEESGILRSICIAIRAWP